MAIATVSYNPFGSKIDDTETNITAINSTTGKVKALTSDNFDSLDASDLTSVPNNVPVGGIIAWLKSFTGTPALSGNYVECNGQVLSDAESVYDGETIPDLNGGNRFMRGNATSGATGGAETMAHTHGVTATTGSPSTTQTVAGSGNTAGRSDHTHNFSVTSDAASNDENRPPFYNVVWIMRIK